MRAIGAPQNRQRPPRGCLGEDFVNFGFQNGDKINLWALLEMLPRGILEENMKTSIWIIIYYTLAMPGTSKSHLFSLLLATKIDEKSVYSVGWSKYREKASNNRHKSGTVHYMLPQRLPNGALMKPKRQQKIVPEESWGSKLGPRRAQVAFLMI